MNMLYLTTCAATLAVGFLVSITGLDAKYKSLFEICCLALDCLYLINLIGFICTVCIRQFKSSTTRGQLGWVAHYYLDYPIISKSRVVFITFLHYYKEGGRGRCHPCRSCMGCPQKKIRNMTNVLG